MAKHPYQVYDSYREMIEMAERGEMQAATRRLGPVQVNPHYFRQPGMVNAAGIFLNTLAPLIRRSPEQSIRLTDVMATENGGQAGETQLQITILLAKGAGFLAVNPYLPKNEDGPAYRLTERGMDTEEADVLVTKHNDPNRLMLPVIAGQAGCMGTVALTEIPQIDDGMAALAITLGLAGAGGAFNVYTRVAAGREAYNYYNS